MKVLLLSSYDLNGGAGKAAFRLLECLNTLPEYEVKMLVMEKSSINSKIISKRSLKIKFFSNLIKSLDNIFLLLYPNRNKSIFSTSWISQLKINHFINDFKPDLINVHWINNTFLTISQLKNVKNIPIIFTLHDMWFFTGGCHYSLNCFKYENICNNCNLLRSKYYHDLSYINYKNKFKFFNNHLKNFYIIGVSNWMTNIAKNSSILKNCTILNLPNAIDTNKYFPICKLESRNALGIQTTKKVLLFGAMNANSNKIKGFDLLKASLNMLDADKYLLLVFGNNNEEFSNEIKIETIKFGTIYDEITMRLLYNSADLFLLPSIQENLSNSVLESLSCETPVVAFDIGGNSDMIINKFNGFLADPYESQHFAYGINYLFENNINQISKNARLSVLNKFSYSVVSQKYKTFFENIISEN